MDSSVLSSLRNCGGMAVAYPPSYSRADSREDRGAAHPGVPAAPAAVVEILPLATHGMMRPYEVSAAASWWEICRFCSVEHPQCSGFGTATLHLSA